MRAASAHHVPGDGRRQRNGLVELASRFYGRQSPSSALIWAAPVWVRTNHWAQREGLALQDETVDVRRRRVTSAGSSHHRLRFAGGASVKVNIKTLRFFYPQRSTTLVHVPRYRKLVTPNNRLVAIGYEEGLALGTPREEVELEQGNYSPNELFFRRGQNIDWLDVPTVTLARLVPDPPPANLAERHFAVRMRFCGRELSNRLNDPLRVLRGEAADDNLPVAARVQFLRVTLHPEDLRVVVLLAAERELDRFLVEHDGLAGLLIERLAGQRMRG